MSAMLNDEGIATINTLPLWEVLRDYEELGIFYVCEDGMVTKLGTEDWGD